MLRFALSGNIKVHDEYFILKRRIRHLFGENSIYIEKEESLSEKLEQAGFNVQKVDYFRFFCRFEHERYLRTKKELAHIQHANSRTWDYIQHRMKSKRITREFMLLVCNKTD